MEASSVRPSSLDASSGVPEALAAENIACAVQDVLKAAPCVDMHTHLYSPGLGRLGLWGIDELLTYHYLEAEFFRFSDMTPESYWLLSKKQQADAIWQTLFVENSPISEATRGVVAVLKAFELPTSSPDLREAREFFKGQKHDAHVSNVFRMAGVISAVMTNDPLDLAEASMWMNGIEDDPRFQASMRLDRLLREWSDPWPQLAAQGYDVDDRASTRSIKQIRRFLSDWYQRMRPVYMAVSLPDEFRFPEDTVRGRILREAVLPSCREFNIPLSVMIGVRKQVNPRIRLAGDAVGKADLRVLERLCNEFPENRFLVSVLSRENQHELCVYARKFSNLMPFGCWWFLNNPSIVEEITRERLEMLGASFIAQHSDARVLEQVIYKWRNTRRTLSEILSGTYRLAWDDGRGVTRQDIERDVSRLLRSNFEDFAARDGNAGPAS
ncbi:MAG TPA: hypothetical protein VKS44_05200 [Candidatus Acidoferrales bacterium]|nr:hypothetical protein [Candidatus Acidoferrales bacterium]